MSVARQRRRVRGITRKSATTKSCMPYVTKNSLIFFFEGDDMGEVFRGASTELSEVTERRMAHLGKELFLVLLLPLDFFNFFIEVVVAAEEAEEEESDILLGRCLSSN